MPHMCCVPECRSNYNKREKNHSMFSFPSNEVLRKQWLNAIERGNFTVTKSSRVCELHFKPEDIERSTKFYSSTGDVYDVPLKHPRLKSGSEIVVPRRNIGLTDDAVPSIFPNLSSDSSMPPRTDFQKPKREMKNEDNFNSVRKSSRKRRLSKGTVPQSEPELSSDDDLPLEKIRNQSQNHKLSQMAITLDESVTTDNDDGCGEDSDQSLSRKFRKLLVNYQQLKYRSIGLNEEINILEQVNVELKSIIFTS